MVLIVGLGNPGRRYRSTRHNLGFMVVDEVAARWQLTFGASRCEAAVAVGEVAGRRVVLAKPETFMNLSGRAVAKLRRAHRVGVEDVLAVYDELDLPLGRVRLRPDGGAAGHNGVASLIEVLGKGFPRLRVGIGRPPPGEDPVDYVLAAFVASELPQVPEVVGRAADAVEAFVRDGVTQAMNTVNRAPI